MAIKHALSVSLSLDREMRFGPYTFTYYVRPDAGYWHEFVRRLQDLHADRFVLIADAGIPLPCIEELREQVAQACWSCPLLFIPAHESAKRLSTIEELSICVEDAGITVNSCLIVLGGGRAANMGGYLAASQFRGIRLVQVPTTLLSMADAMPSLKQAVNTPRGKNHVGAFYAPVFVWNNLSFLRTLPTIEIQSALCEMIKFVLTLRPDVYQDVLHMLRPDGQYTQEQLLRIIQICIEAKCAVLQADPFERQQGLIFEYGHTVGHPLEQASNEPGCQPVPHGIAVGLGMLAAARVARLMGLLSAADEAKHLEILQHNGTPTRIPAAIDPASLLTGIAHDNKRGRLLPLSAGRHNMVLLKGLGVPNMTGGTVLTQVEENQLLSALYSST